MLRACLKGATDNTPSSARFHCRALPEFTHSYRVYGPAKLYKRGGSLVATLLPGEPGL